MLRDDRHRRFHRAKEESSYPPKNKTMLNDKPISISSESTIRRRPSTREHRSRIQIQFTVAHDKAILDKVINTPNFKRFLTFKELKEDQPDLFCKFSILRIIRSGEHPARRRERAG